MPVLVGVTVEIRVRNEVGRKSIPTNSYSISGEDIYSQPILHNVNVQNTRRPPQQYPPYYHYRPGGINGPLNRISHGQRVQFGSVTSTEDGELQFKFRDLLIGIFLVYTSAPTVVLVRIRTTVFSGRPPGSARAELVGDGRKHLCVILCCRTRCGRDL